MRWQFAEDCVRQFNDSPILGKIILSAVDPRDFIGVTVLDPAGFSLKFRQGVMNKANGNRSFTHGGGHALHVTRPNVPNCKNSG